MKMGRKNSLHSAAGRRRFDRAYWLESDRRIRVDDNGPWRSFCDRLNRDLLRKWMPEAAARIRVLKTDLFEEAHGEGLLSLFSFKSHQITGIEIAAPVAAAAVKRTEGLKALCGDTRRLPFSDGVFDLVISTSTLDHFTCKSDITEALSEICRVMKPGASLFLTLDNLANPVVRLRNRLPFHLLHRFGIVPYFVGETLTPDQLKNAMRTANLQLLEMAASMHAPRMAAVLIAGAVRKTWGTHAADRFLKIMQAFEVFNRLPFRYRTGHFIAVKAIRRY